MFSAAAPVPASTAMEAVADFISPTVTSSSFEHVELPTLSNNLPGDFYYRILSYGGIRDTRLSAFFVISVSNR
jgi:hypothetical protein